MPDAHTLINLYQRTYGTARDAARSNYTVGSHEMQLAVSHEMQLAVSHEMQLTVDHTRCSSQ